MEILTKLRVVGNIAFSGAGALNKQLSRVNTSIKKMQTGMSRTASGIRDATRHARRGRVTMHQYARNVDLAARSATRLRHSLMSLATGTIVGAAIGTLIGKLGALNDGFRKTEVSLAGVLSNVYGGGTLAQTMPDAKGLARQLAFAAAKTPGSASELQNAFVQLAPIAGKNTTDLTDFASKLLVAGHLSRGDVGRQNIIGDISQALDSGKINARQMKDVRMAFAFAGMDTAEFDNAKQSEKMAVLTKALDALGDQIDLLKNTFEYQSTTLVSYLQLLTSAGTSDFTGKFAGSMGGVNDFLEKHFEWFEAVLKGIAPAITAIGTAAGSLFVTFAAVGTFLGMAGSLFAILGAEAVVGGMVTVVAGFVALAATLPALGLFVAALVASLQEGTVTFEEIGLAINRLLYQFVIPLGEGLWDLGEALWFAFKDLLAEGFGKEMDRALEQLETFAIGIRFLGDMLSAVADVIEAVALRVNAHATMALGIYQKDAHKMATANQLFIRSEMKMSDAENKALQAYVRLFMPLSYFKPGADGGKDYEKSKNTTNINGDIRVVVKADTIEDPQRVAVVWEQFLAETALRSRSATRTGPGGSFQ